MSYILFILLLFEVKKRTVLGVSVILADQVLELCCLWLDIGLHCFVGFCLHGLNTCERPFK